MDMPAGIAATLDRLATTIGSRAATARGVLDRDGCSEAYQAPRSPGVVVLPETTQGFHSSPDLRA